MKYLLDNHSISASVLERDNKGKVCVLEDVLEDNVNTEEELRRIRRANIEIISLSGKHLRKIAEVLAKHGKNLRFIRWYTAEGAADVAMLAYALSERDEQGTLFGEREFVIVSRDKTIADVAQSYGVKCVDSVPKV